MDGHSVARGDVGVRTGPYAGGTHLPDITLVAPIFVARHPRPAFYAANRAHHADVGGIAPGSLSLASEIYQEGIILPPVKICRGGELDEDLLSVFLRNVRTPDERRGDLLAQLAANRIGIKRIEQYVARYGLDEVAAYAAALQDSAEPVTRSLLVELPDCEVHSLDYLDDDGLGTCDLPIALALRIQGDTAIFDFTA